MQEKLYTIPVTDAFQVPCECPICAMKQTLEANAIEYTMGASYMEEDVRAVTDQLGFCEKHIKLLYAYQNRLGLALILNTHLQKTIQDLEKKTKHTKVSSTSFFHKNTNENEVSAYINHLNASCFVCNNIDHTFERYLITIFHLYKTEPDFKQIFNASLGMCSLHFGLLHEMAPNHLKSSHLVDFITDINRLYLDNIKRVKADLDWFIDKFDYRNSDKPWNTSKDALTRSIIKTNSIIL